MVMELLEGGELFDYNQPMTFVAIRCCYCDEDHDDMIVWLQREGCDAHCAKDFGGTGVSAFTRGSLSLRVKVVAVCVEGSACVTTGCASRLEAEQHHVCQQEPDDRFDSPCRLWICEAGRR